MNYCSFHCIGYNNKPILYFMQTGILLLQNSYERTKHLIDVVLTGLVSVL